MALVFVLAIFSASLATIVSFDSIFFLVISTDNCLLSDLLLLAAVVISIWVGSKTFQWVVDFTSVKDKTQEEIN